MACVRRRRGRWIADFRDATGRRRWVTCRTKAEAEDVLAVEIPASRQRRYPVVEADITVAEYAERWLKLSSGLKPRTLQGYREKLDNHVLPAFGTLQVRRLHRGAIRTVLAEKLKAGLSIDSVRLIHATLRALLNAAVEDDLLRGNPAARLGRSLRLSTTPAERGERVRAFDREQLVRFLEAAGQKAPRLRPVFHLMSRTGLRVGEALGLQWTDISLDRGQLRVERAISTTGQVTTPKSGHGRTVDLSWAAVEELRDHLARKTEAGLARGAGGPSSWAFVEEKGKRPIPRATVSAGFARALRAAKLPSHFSPHSLRHTYASLLLAGGAPMAYVQEQLGHSTIKLTVDTYGRWAPKQGRWSLDILEREGGEASDSGRNLRSSRGLDTTEPLPAAVNAGRGSGSEERGAGPAMARVSRTIPNAGAKGISDDRTPSPRSSEPMAPCSNGAAGSRHRRERESEEGQPVTAPGGSEGPSGAPSAPRSTASKLGSVRPVAKRSEMVAGPERASECLTPSPTEPQPQATGVSGSSEVCGEGGIRTPGGAVQTPQQISNSPTPQPQKIPAHLNRTDDSEEP